MLTNLILLFQADEGQEAQSVFQIVAKSGYLGMAILAILVTLSIIGIYIFVERYFTIKDAQQFDENFMTNIRISIQSGNVEAARNLCRNTDSPIARMVEKGLMRIGKSSQDIQTAIENVGNLEVVKLESNTSTLATIAGAAPMIGFFGTVTGMIIAFRDMATATAVSPSLLAGGIYQALLTTALGLFIGILAYIGYNILVAQIGKVIFNMEATSMEFIDLLEEPA